MKKEKSKEKECPLCEVSQDTLEKLKQENRKISLNEPDKKKREFWRKALILIAILVLAGFAFYSFFLNFSFNNKEKSTEKEEIFKASDIGSLASDFTLEDTLGNKITLSDFQNKKPVLLVFWATWCGYCAKELPDLKIFTGKYQNEIQVIAISSGEVKETVKNYVEEENINFPMLLDEKRETWNQYSVRGTPSHFLIDKKGEIVTLRPGLALINDLETMLMMLE